VAVKNKVNGFASKATEDEVVRRAAVAADERAEAVETGASFGRRVLEPETPHIVAAKKVRDGMGCFMNGDSVPALAHAFGSLALLTPLDELIVTVAEIFAPMSNVARTAIKRWHLSSLSVPRRKILVEPLANET
jgi:hypothetical protein